MAQSIAPASPLVAGAPVAASLRRSTCRQELRPRVVRVAAASRKKAARRERTDQLDAAGPAKLKSSGTATTLASPDDGSTRAGRAPADAATARGTGGAAAPSSANLRGFEERSTDGTPAASSGAAVLPAASREDVLGACAKTAAFMAVSAVVLRQLSSWAAASGYPVNDATALVQFGLDPGDLGLIAVAVGAVSVARLALLRISPEFALSSDRSNAQVLSNLSLGDIAAVATLSGASEELLFRGAMLPILGLNWVGVIIAGAIFGTLHLSGGRNAVFAVWAAAVGILYGWLTLASESTIDPMIAHSVANLVAALLWKFTNDEA